MYRWYCLKVLFVVVVVVSGNAIVVVEAAFT